MSPPTTPTTTTKTTTTVLCCVCMASTNLHSSPTFELREHFFGRPRGRRDLSGRFVLLWLSSLLSIRGGTKATGRSFDFFAPLSSAVVAVSSSGAGKTALGLVIFSKIEICSLRETWLSNKSFRWFNAAKIEPHSCDVTSLLWFSKSWRAR